MNLVSQHSGLKLDIRLSDAFADIVNDGVDLAVRIGSRPDSNLIARKITSQQWVLCASPIYLKKQGIPLTLGQLSEHDAVLFRMPTTGRNQVWCLKDGAESWVFEPQTRFKCSDGEGISEVVSRQITFQKLDAEIENGTSSRWYVFDPSGTAIPMDVVRFCASRDAADIAFATIFGRVNMMQQVISIRAAAERAE